MTTVKQTPGEELLKAYQQISTLTAQLDEAENDLNWIKNEISCRIEHGADSNGHLEFFHKHFIALSNAKAGGVA